MDIKKTFAERIKYLRRRTGKTQLNVTNDTGLSIVQYERGVMNPGAIAVRTLADYYGVSTDYLLGKIDNPDLEITTGVAPEHKYDCIKVMYAVRDAIRSGVRGDEIIEMIGFLKK